MTLDEALTQVAEETRRRDDVYARVYDSGADASWTRAINVLLDLTCDYTGPERDALMAAVAALREAR